MPRAILRPSHPVPEVVLSTTADFRRASRSNLHKAARAYAANGWPVFPVAPRSKVPALSKASGGNGCHDATSDLAKVDAWWSPRPHFNIGVATGVRSGMAVVDLDPAKGGSRAALPDGVPDTLTSRTGGGGSHLVFQAPRGRLHNSRGQIAPGVDICGDGGYFVAPPSVHSCGRAYEWVDATVAPAPWPSVLNDVLAARPWPTCSGNVRPFAGDGRRALVGLVQFVLDSIVGERNAKLFWATCRAAEHVAAGRLDAEVCVAALIPAAEEVGLPRVEARRTVESGMGRPE